MPELPEVETVRRGLQPLLEAQRILHVRLRRDGLRRPFPPGMADRLAGVRVERLRRRGKYILGDLSSGDVLLIHLGMTGRFHHGRGAPGKHDHMMIELQSGETVFYNDPRRFGVIDLFAGGDEAAHPLLCRLGPEPLGADFHEDHLYRAFSGRRSAVKPALLDQRIVAGLGNIYVSEALWRARLSPLRAAGRISHARIVTLVQAIRTVLDDAIEGGGSTLRDYRRIDGEIGGFQEKFAVYGRDGGSCRHADCKGKIRRITQAGRATFYCPRCQR